MVLAGLCHRFSERLTKGRRGSLSRYVRSARGCHSGLLAPRLTGKAKLVGFLTKSGKVVEDMKIVRYQHFWHWAVLK